MKRRWGSQVVHYFKSFIPIVDWLPHYQKPWLIPDFISGITIGIVTIPQALAYAKVVGLPVEYGLYTALVGAFIYPFVSTSKEVSVGPTAVISLLTAQLISTYNSESQFPTMVFTSMLALFTGIFQAVLGAFRLGIVVDFIPIPVIAGFTSGAAITISISQLPKLFGIPSSYIDGNTSGQPAAYYILYRFITHIHKAKLDAAFGLPTILFLLLIKWVANKISQKKKYHILTYIVYLRNGFAMIIFTTISFFLNHSFPQGDERIAVIQTVPTGFHPTTSSLSFSSKDLIKSVMHAAVLSTMIGVLEHVAVTQSHARKEGYRPNSNQELFALGIVNIVGSFFGCFPGTGSFSRSCIKSQSGVKSPLSDLFHFIVLLLALYVLTPCFYYVPDATLAGIIIVAVNNLISRPAVIKQFLSISIVDFVTFMVALLLTFLYSIEVSVMGSVLFSILVLLYRLARPRYQELVQISESGPWMTISEYKQRLYTPLVHFRNSACLNDHPKKTRTLNENSSLPHRTVKDCEKPPLSLNQRQGIFVFRIEESLTYPSANYINDQIKSLIVDRVRFGGSTNKTERLWFEKSPKVNQNPSSSSIASDQHSKAKYELEAYTSDGDWNKRKSKETTDNSHHQQNHNLSSSELNFGTADLEKNDNTVVEIEQHDITDMIPNSVPPSPPTLIYDASTSASTTSTLQENNTLPALKGVIFDFSAVNGLDATGIQMLVDLRNSLQVYSGEKDLPFHFVHVHHRLKRTLKQFFILSHQHVHPAPSHPHRSERDLDQVVVVSSLGTVDHHGSEAKLKKNMEHGSKTETHLRNPDYNIIFFHSHIEDAFQKIYHYSN